MRDVKCSESSLCLKGVLQINQHLPASAGGREEERGGRRGEKRRRRRGENMGGKGGGKKMDVKRKERGRLPANR